MGCRFQMLLGHSFVFGDIGLCRKNLKTYFFKFKPRSFQPWQYMQVEQIRQQMLIRSQD